MVTDKGLMWSVWCYKREQTHWGRHISCHIYQVNTEPGATLTLKFAPAFTISYSRLGNPSLLSGDKSEALWLHRHHTASLSTHVASLLSIHMHKSLPRKRPLLRKQSKLLTVELVSPTEWITKLCTDTNSHILLLSLTADRLAQWVGRQIANLALPHSATWAKPWVTCRISRGKKLSYHSASLSGSHIKFAPKERTSLANVQQS